ncbi:MAG: BamA/TamA family outer membrane protein [Bacteroidetes bacterium]|nr:BamA/TamA family outer membrane protein [Bacteroidota bacterium]
MLKTSIKILFAFLILLSPVAAQNKTTLKLNLVTKSLPFGLTEQVPANIPKIGLALSGGGARSISQLGVLRAFEEAQIPIDIIVGTSMGGVVGGLYSAGYSLNDLDSILQRTTWNDLFSPQQSSRKELFVDQKISEDRAIVSFRLDGFKFVIPTSISSGQRAANFLNLLAINAPLQSTKSFDDFKYKYRAVSSDLVTGNEVILDKGLLGVAMRATSSVSFVLPPVKDDSLMLVDGGLVANIPAVETRKAGADIVVAVDCVSPLYSDKDLIYPWIIADQIVSIPMQKLNNQQLSTADFVVRPELDRRKNSDFDNLKSVIKSGYDAAKPIAQKIKKNFVQKLEAAFSNKEKFYKNLVPGDSTNKLDESFVHPFYGRDSVSSGELLYALYKKQSEGGWKNLSIDIDERDGKSFVTLDAVKNPIVTKINLEGVEVGNEGLIYDLFDGLINKPYDAMRTFNSALDALRYYKNDGYSLARIDNISFDEKTGVLSVRFSEGLINELTVVGNTKTREEIITREFPLKAGDYFKYSLAEKGLANLRSTNLFDQAEVIVSEKDNKNNVAIKVTEKISRVLRLGLRIDNENQAQLSFDLRDENFNGSGQELGAIFSGGLRNRTLILEQRANRVFDSYLTYKIQAFHEFNDVNVYKDDTLRTENEFHRKKTGEYRQIYYGGSFGIGTQVERFGNLFVEARYQRDEVKNKYDYYGPTYKMDISSLRFSMYIDSQNEYPYPTSGFLIKAYYETAQTALGGDIGYTKFYFDYKNIFSFKNNNTWSLRAVIGTADNTLPLSEQFSFGGQNSFFGLRDNEYRGRQILLASLEYRYKLPVQLFFDTYLKLRYDLGSIWAERQQIRFKDLRHGIGATVSFKTPIGPADFSLGQSFYFKNTFSNNAIVWGDTFFYFTIGYYY